MRKLYFIPLLLLFFVSCKSKKQQTIKEVTITNLTQEKDEPPPPPPPIFDLTHFNVFVLSNKHVYYYYNYDFRPVKEFDQYKLESIDKKFLHKSSFTGLKDMIIKLKKGNLLRDTTVWLAVQDYDKELTTRALNEIIKPADLSHTSVGYIPYELDSLLRTIK
jgi:hypothetical protein